MLKVLPNRPARMDGHCVVALVASQYNPLYVQGLVDHAAAEISAIMPAATLEFYQVPGAWEIPVVVQELARRTEGQADVIIALGVIIQGETAHADHLGRSVTEALQQIALRSRVPVIHQVLSVRDEAQARVRCLKKKHNRGTEAARAALAMAQLMATLKTADGTGSPARA